MKKSLLLLLGSLFLYMASVSAQWSSDIENPLQLSTVRSTFSGENFTKKLQDGRVYVCWLYSMYSTNGKQGFGIKLILLNEDGTVAEGWPEGGLIVSDKWAPSYTTGYGVTLAADNSVVITHTDSRNYEGTDNNFGQAFAYRVSADGKHLWGEDGVALVEDIAKYKLSLRPKVSERNDGNIIITWSDNYTHEIHMNILAIEDGHKLLADDVIIPDGITPNAMASGQDKVILTYRNLANNVLYAQKYDKNGQAEWLEAVAIAESYPVANNGDLRGIYPDGEDGLFVTWQAGVGNFHYAVVQRISSDGDLLMGLDGAVPTNVKAAMQTSPAIAIDYKNQVIYMQFIDARSSQNTVSYVQKFDFSGNRYWGDTAMKLDKANNSSVLGMVNTDNGAIGLYASSASISAYRVEPDGNILWDRIVSKKVGYNGSISNLVNDQIVISWGSSSVRDESSWMNLYSQNIKVDGSIGNITSIEENTLSNHFRVYTDHENKQVKIVAENVRLVSATADVYDAYGRRVARLTMADDHSFTWNAGNVKSGVYFISVLAGNERVTSKILL